jgi:adenine-specific DNA glycosylase
MHRGRWLVRQRPAGSVNAHLWEFPNCEVNGSKPRKNGVLDLLLGFHPSEAQPLCSISHTITRYRIRMDVLFAKFQTKEARRVGALGQWHTLEELRQLPFPSAHRKVVDQLSSRHEAPGI